MRENKLKKGLVYVTIVCFIVICAGFMGKSKLCFATEQQTVKVGIFSLGQFMGWNEKNEATGYNVDYLNKIAERNHWKYQYVDCNNWVEATKMLEKGDIDLLAPAQKTEVLEDQFDFATNSMGIEAAAIYTNASRDDLSYEAFDDMKKLTYGVAKGSTFAKKFSAEYVKEHGLHPTIKEYENTTELMKALKEKKVDAIVTNIMFYSDDVKLLGWFTPLPVYYIAQKGNQKLLNQVDTAMTEIMVQEPEFQAQLESKYFPVFNNTNLSYKEQEYVKKLPVISLGYVVNNKPVSYEDSETKEFKGITRDILDQISKNTGIKFRYVALPTKDVTSAYLKKHHIYVVSNVEVNEINQNLKIMNLSTPFLDSERVLISDGELKFHSKSKLHVAVATGSGTLINVIQQEYPNFTVETYESIEECFDAVREKEVDATIQNRYVADNTMENPLYSNLTVSPAHVLDDKLGIATVEVDLKNSICEMVNDSLFISIVDKGIKQISNEELNAIVIKNTSNTHYNYSVSDFVRKYALTLVAVGILVAMCIVFLVYIQRMTKAKNKELEKKNDQLADAVAQADRANTAKSKFLSSMSHEIRTPMNAIVGLTSIARKYKNDPAKTEDYLTKIDTSSKVLLNIINDVLDMSAIESNKLKIDRAEFDIKTILSGISTIYYPQCKNKGITFEMVIDLENELLVGDSLRVNQILMNLISNAYKFTEKGSIRIVVQETARRDHKAFIRFKVSDTGCGIDPEMKERLFLPFEQESAGTAKKHGGSGLGLSIAKNLVDMMHGAISVESEKGVGTTFQVDLPFELTGRTCDEDTGVLDQIHILVVDDDAQAREYTGIVLNRIGVEFDTADSGKVALELYKREASKGRPYDVCLIDWKMPDMDGVELTRQIRKQSADQSTIIIVSAYDLNEVEDTATKAGANHFVSKPLFQSTVFNVLMTLANGKIRTESAKVEDYDFTGHKVLLAEDNEMNAEIATELLNMVHLEVDHAENGEVAVQKFESSEIGTYDAILMDIQMPVMDGYEATKRIRESSKEDAKKVPIYAMTANAFTEDVSTALSAGMNGHIAKPIDTEVLYSTLAKAMGIKK